MKVLLTGANGYIGKRLLPMLVANGYQVVCCVRDPQRFTVSDRLKDNVEVVQVDFLHRETLKNIPKDIDGAYYLMHSMSTASNYERLEALCAFNFRIAMESTAVKHVVYLGGILNGKNLSRHLVSRMSVESTLSHGDYHFTSLRSGIIIGSGSASFEIIRDLVEKLPVMVTPQWLLTKCQPIGVNEVLMYLTKTLFNEQTFDISYDIGGKDVLTYKEMLLRFAKHRGLKRFILTLPVMTPRLSSYWLFFVTSTSFKLAQALVSSMKVEVVCKENNLAEILGIVPRSYDLSLDRTFQVIEDGTVLSSWKDSLVSGRFGSSISEFYKVPSYGCLKDVRSTVVNDRMKVIQKIWKIGGDTGWYFATWLWSLRGFIDQLFGGVGLRRGRTHPEQLSVGDSVDFWRVIFAEKNSGRLLLFAEMKLPGEAWLELKFERNRLYQIATFRPKGLWGRLYWYAIYPLHSLIFKGMITQLAK